MDEAERLNRAQLTELHRFLNILVDARAFNGALAISLANELKVELPYGIEVLNEQTANLRTRLDLIFQHLYPVDEQDQVID